MQNTNTDTISTIQELVSALEQDEYEQVIDQVPDLEFTIEELAPYLHWSKTKYTRNCIARNKNFELIALCWEAGQQTPIHSHDNQECWVKVVKGSFVEKTYEMNKGKLNQLEEIVLTKHDSTFLEDLTQFHSLGNTSDERAVSLHLYMKPIESCAMLDEVDNKIKVVNLTYHSFKGVLVQ